MTADSFCFICSQQTPVPRRASVCTPSPLPEGVFFWWFLCFFCVFLIVSSSFCSAYTVLKFMMMWTLVLLADFILEFRLEYLWPCWLFFGSVYTTFHCHGLVALCFFSHFKHVSLFVTLTLYSKLNSLMSCSFSAGYLCGVCLCCLHPGHLLSNFCPLALALLCCQHLCLI